MMRAYNRLLDICGWTAGAMIAFSALAVTLDVLMKPFGKSLIWVFETTEILLLYITMLAQPWLARARGHIAVDVVVSNLPKAVAARLEVLTNAVAVVACVLIAYWGSLSAADAYARGLTSSGLLNYPVWISRITVPLGFGLAAVEFLRLSIRTIRTGAAK